MDSHVKFARHVERDHVTGCLLWTKSLTKGYPQFVCDGETHARRWAYKHLDRRKPRAIPAHHDVYLTCQNTMCVEPRHMALRAKNSTYQDLPQLPRINPQKYAS